MRLELSHRVQGIQGVVRAIAAAALKPAVLVSASSVGTYGYSGWSDAVITESSPPGEDYWGQSSVEWEGAALAAEELGVRTVVPRFGYVLDARPHSDGGLMRQVAQFRSGYGGHVEPGTQWSPWLHVADAAGLIEWALDYERVRGPINGVAPGTVRNREFADVLATVVGRPALHVVSGEMLRARMGVVADSIVHGRRVVPATALKLGYRFLFPTLEAALRDLVPPDNGQTTGWGDRPHGADR